MARSKKQKKERKARGEESQEKLVPIASSGGSREERGRWKPHRARPGAEGRSLRGRRERRGLLTHQPAKKPRRGTARNRRVLGKLGPGGEQGGKTRREPRLQLNPR